MTFPFFLRFPLQGFRARETGASVLVGIFLSTAAVADAPSVVTTIKPLHSIAAAVMEGVGEPHLLIDGSASPHGFSLKPSQAFLLQGADTVFWIGPGLAPSLEKPIHSMAADAVRVELMDSAGVNHLKIREGTNFDAHDHGDHEHHDDEAKHDEHDEHDHQETTHSDDHENEHVHSEANDPHIWLNPDNGIAIAHVMAATLANLDPEHAETYKTNAENFGVRIEQLETNIANELSTVSSKKFIVFHDGYHHFEHHFGIEASGAITLSPEALSSADRIAEVQTQIRDLEISCVFQEPQFDTKLVTVVLEGSTAQIGTLDPLGTGLQNGPDLYPNLLKNIAQSMKDCLSGAS